MTIQEAITEARKIGRERLWFRPVSWRKTGQALCLKDQHCIYQVPDSNGGHWAFMPTPDAICGEWELVDPHRVSNERT